MKAKISRGKGFKGALDYCLDEQKGGQVVGGNMSSDSAAELSSEFSVSRALRPDCKKPVWHCSLSLPQGERLSDQKWHEVTNDYMQKMGLDPANHQFVAVRHADTEHDHVHIIASRIGLDSKLWHGQHDVRQAINACQELEKTHGLTLTPGLDMDEKAHKASLKRGEIEIAVKTGEAPPKLVLQQAIDEALQDNPDTAAFIERLEAAGITPRPNIASTGRMNGFSFECDGIAFKASQLGKSYSFGQLCKRGLDYDQERDADILRAAKERSAAAEEDLAPPPDDQQSKQYRRTVDYMTEVKPGQWRFESGRHIAVKELESGGMWCAKTDTAAKAALQLALDKGWSTITVKTEDAQHAERLYRAALQVGYPPHVITLAHDQLSAEQIQEINKEFGYEQNAASQSNGSAAQQSDQRADQRAAATPEPERRELSEPDRAISAIVSSTERGRQADNNRERELFDEEAQRGAGRVGESNRGAGQRAGASEQTQQQLARVDQRDQTAAAQCVAQGLDSSDQHERNNSGGAVDRVYGLAAPAQHRPAKRVEMVSEYQSTGPATDSADSQRQQSIAPHIRAKQHAWKAQHEALQAPAYRITLTARREELQTYNMGKGRGAEGAEKFYSAEEVRDLIPQLSRQNARGYDIYITPIDGQQHYIVLDDSDKQRLEQMHERTGITPVLVQESSPGNLQAIIKADKVQGQHEQSNANYIVQGLNKQYGDPKFTGVVHPFRMSGYMNQKEQYEQNGRRPIVRPRPVLQCKPGADPTLNAMLDKQREQQQQQQQRQEQEQQHRREQEHRRAREDRIRTFKKPSGSRIDAEQRYLIEARKCVDFVREKGWPLDYSKIDFYVCKQMLKDDYFSEKQIGDAIKSCSPNLADRHNDVDNYAKRTVENAAQDPEVVQHRESERELELSGPSLG